MHATLGSVFSETGRLADALAHMEKAVELRPDYGEAYSNHGKVLRDLGRIDDAHAAYGRALDLIPSDAHAHVNRGVALLLTGDFAAGWEEYEWRLETPEARDVSGLPARWGLGGDDCPWYPTMRLIRQGQDQPWGEVLAPLASEIADFK